MIMPRENFASGDRFLPRIHVFLGRTKQRNRRLVCSPTTYEFDVHHVLGREPSKLIPYACLHPSPAPARPGAASRRPLRAQNSHSASCAASKFLPGPFLRGFFAARLSDPQLASLSLPAWHRERLGCGLSSPSSSFHLRLILAFSLRNVGRWRRKAHSGVFCRRQSSLYV